MRLIHLNIGQKNPPFGFEKACGGFLFSMLNCLSYDLFCGNISILSKMIQKSFAGGGKICMRIMHNGDTGRKGRILNGTIDGLSVLQ